GAALVADRYTYLSSIGLFYIIAEFIVYIYRKNKTIFIFLFISAFVWLITTFGYYNFDFKPQQFYYYFVGISIIYILFAFIILFFHERKKIIGAAILTVIGIFIFLCCYHIFSYRCGVWQNTLNLWNDVIKHYPTATLAYNNRGCIFMGAGDFEKAKADFTVGLKINPYDYSLLSNLGLLYYMNNKLDESIGIHLQLIQLYPQSSENYFKLAFLYYTQKKTSECLAVYKTLMTYTDKFNYKIYNNLGIIARRENKYDKAEYFFKHSIKLKNDYPLVYNNLGVLYYYQKKYDEAAKNFEKAIELNQYYAEPHNNLGEVYFEKKEYHKALEYYIKALMLNPNYPDAIENYEKVQKILEAEENKKNQSNKLDL
ncbi:MAG TPA: tetratricopeptide repeat protein, partial [bacterium]|nr:tetratricopeptide repeat protein [bacterium]